MSIQSPCNKGNKSNLLEYLLKRQFALQEEYIDIIFFFYNYNMNFDSILTFIYQYNKRNSLIIRKSLSCSSKSSKNRRKLAVSKFISRGHLKSVWLGNLPRSRSIASLSSGAAKLGISLAVYHISRVTDIMTQLQTFHQIAASVCIERKGSKMSRYNQHSPRRNVNYQSWQQISLVKKLLTVSTK